MKEIISFLKEKRNVKYSLWIIIFGLIFTFSFLTNQARISQILEKPVRIVPGSKEARQYQVSGWHGSWAKGKRSILRVSLPEKKIYQMVVRAFSCSPPDARDQRIEVHFNNVALDRLKFKKTPKWQEFLINIPPYLPSDTNIIKFVYTQDTRRSPITFHILEFRNYTARLGGLYLLFDQSILHKPEESPLFLRLLFWPASRPPLKEVSLYSKFKVFGSSLAFIILLWTIWLFYSCFLFRLIPACRRGRGGPAGEAGRKMKFFRAAKIDLWSYLPSVILLLGLALFSFFSSYHFVYSLRAFFILALAPTVLLKLFPYKDLFPPSNIIKSAFKFILRDIKKTCLEIKRATSFLKEQPNTARKFLIRYHKTNPSSAFILDFMLLLILCALFLIMGVSFIAEGLAVIAYFLLFIAIVMKAVQFFRGVKKGRRE